MRLHDIVATSRSVGETSARSDKIRRLAGCLRRAEPDDIRRAVAFLSGEPRQGRFGLGPATLRAAMPPAAAPIATLTLAELDAALDRVAGISGDPQLGNPCADGTQRKKANTHVDPSYGGAIA
jgi:DNA ligase 1